MADRLGALGAVVVDADQLAREVVAPGSPGLAEVVREFGRQVLAADGSLDRPAMARLVFDAEPARRRLEAIIHPRVRVAAQAREAAASLIDPDAVVVHVVPLLIETDQADSYDVVVVVDVDLETQMRRLVALRGMDPVDARQRVDAQASRDERMAAADEVIHNTSSVAELDRQVDALWHSLMARR